MTLLSWIIPDGIPGEEFILPAIAVIGLLLRRRLMRNFYQRQYQQYQQYRQGQTGRSGTYSQGAYGSGSAGGYGPGSSGQSSSSFYSRFRNWGGGFQQPSPGTGSLKDPHDILGVSRNASMDEIKKAYRDQLKKYHPDKVESLKLGPEYREMFEEKTMEIQKAYEALGGK